MYRYTLTYKTVLTAKVKVKWIENNVSYNFYLACSNGQGQYQMMNNIWSILNIFCNLCVMWEVVLRCKCILSIGRFRGHQGCLPPPWGPNSLILMQFSAKKLQNNVLAQPLWDLAPFSGKFWIRQCSVVFVPAGGDGAVGRGSGVGHRGRETGRRREQLLHGRRIHVSNRTYHPIRTRVTSCIITENNK